MVLYLKIKFYLRENGINYPKYKVLVVFLILFTCFSGCISEDPEQDKLVILTYDVSALSGSMISNFENNTGLEVQIIKVDDAGSILSYLIQNKGTDTVDLAPRLCMYEPCSDLAYSRTQGFGT